jgi:ABC-type sugar transport system permease subunit
MEQLTHLPKLPSISSFRDMTPMARREARNGLLFILPWIFGFLAFTFIPMIATLWFSFIDLKLLDGILNPPKFVGFENYQHLFADNTVWNVGSGTPGSLFVTMKFLVLSLPFAILLPLGLALLMNNKHLKGQNLFRSLFYMPFIIPFVASVFLWGGVLNPETGWINRILVSIGLPKDMTPRWTLDMFWVYPAFILMGIWGVGNAMLTMLAGMQAVPTDLYDAAKVDGAGPLCTFMNVTLPMISPVIFFNLVLSLVGLFQYFLVPLVVNQGTGAPGGATMFYNLYLYKQFFLYGNMSYGATLAWVLFLVILVVTIILFSTAKYWVFYASDRD